MKLRGYSIALAGLLLVGAGCAGGAGVSTQQQATPHNAPAAQGRAVFTITDAATSLTGITAVNLTVDKVEAHMADGDWVTVASMPKQYDLLQLKATNSAELLADANLAAGTYDQVRLDISKVELTVDGKTQPAKLPSNTLKIVGKLTVVAGQTATAQLDFMVDKSLHLTGSGTYILAPVVRLVTKSGATVSVGSDKKVQIGGGKTDTDETVGMDAQGETKAGFELNGDLELDASGAVRIKQSTEGSSSGSASGSASSDSHLSADETATVAVDIKGFVFLPAAITVNKGGKVVFTNDDSVAHTVTSDDGSFNSATVSAGSKYTLNVSGLSPGVYAFHCSIHPSMHGTIIVK